MAVPLGVMRARRVPSGVWLVRVVSVPVVVEVRCPSRSHSCVVVGAPVLVVVFVCPSGV